MIFICFVLLFIIICYFSNKDPKPDPKQEPFLHCNTFNGAKKGYVFKKCSQGIGYYIDSK